jgi:Ca2+/Na+ antiporter
MRITVGVISIVLSVIVFFQSMVAGLGNALSQNGQSGGSGGFLLSVLMLISGIIILAAKKSRGAQITSSVLLLVGALIAYMLAGGYGDLYIWATIALVFAIFDYLFVARKIPKNNVGPKDSSKKA